MRSTLRRSDRGLAVVLGAIVSTSSAALAQTSTSEPAPVGVAVAATPSAVSVLPHDLSPWSMFLNADSVVKAILIGLAFASVVTWTVWLAKSLELTVGRRRLTSGVNALKSSPTLTSALERVRGTGTAAAAFAEAAGQELDQSGAGLAKAGVVERVQLSLQRIEASLGRRMQRGTGVLATIGSTAPFVGLFGTVWGIMNSFVGISRMQTTNLAVVAPGIAEALLATAIGLVAAIPAVVIYNVFARGIAGYRALMADASAEVLRLVSRDLDRHEAVQREHFEIRSSLRIAE